jgi:hypothetical protein
VTRIINLHTKESREIKPPEPSHCILCESVVSDGLEGIIGEKPVTFCQECMGGIITIMMENKWLSK